MNRAVATLVLLNRIPFPLDDGWKVRTFHLLRAVAQAGPTRILSYDTGAHEDLLRELAGDVTLRLVPPVHRYTVRQLLRGLVGPLPLYVHLEDSTAYRAAVREEVARGPDVVLCELTALFEPLKGLGIDSRIVIDTHNVDSIVFERYAKVQPTLARRMYAGVTSQRLRQYESEVFGRVGAVVVCSDAELAPVRERAAAARCVVVPNGAELSLSRDAGTMGDGRRLFFFGRLDYHPNRDAVRYFVEAIYPRILAARPDAEFHVAGAGDDGTVAALLAGVRGASFRGRVEDLKPELAGAGVVVVPLRAGGGTRLKILEALAASRPVVSTTVGAEGLSLADGVDGIRLADAPADFARAVVNLMNDRNAASRLGVAGRRAVEERYGWGPIGGSLVELLHQVAARASSPGPTAAR